jgi:hypothetical protein
MFKCKEREIVLKMITSIINFKIYCDSMWPQFEKLTLSEEESWNSS